LCFGNAAGEIQQVDWNVARGISKWPLSPTSNTTAAAASHTVWGDWDPALQDR
jgi:hypothetical protein